MHRPWKYSLFPEWEWELHCVGRKTLCLQRHWNHNAGPWWTDDRDTQRLQASPQVLLFYHFAFCWKKKTWSSNENIFKYFYPQRGSEPSSCSSRVMEQQQGWEGEGWVQERGCCWFSGIISRSFNYFFKDSTCRRVNGEDCTHSTLVTLPAILKSNRCIMELFTVVLGFIVFRYTQWMLCMLNIWMVSPCIVFLNDLICLISLIVYQKTHRFFAGF